MWGYRLPKAEDGILLTWPVSVIRTRLEKRRYQVVDRVPLEAFDRDHRHAHKMAKALGWDGTFVAEPNCFSVPVPDDSMACGFIITQATSGQRYITAPVPLQYLDDVVDWDAKINDAEVIKMKAILVGDKPLEAPVVEVGDWVRSKAGNYYTTINGTNVTIVKANHSRGFKACIPIHADKSKTIYTKACATELEAIKYVTENFNTLIADLRREAAISPLAGVNWGDDDPDDDIPF